MLIPKYSPQKHKYFFRPNCWCCTNFLCRRNSKRSGKMIISESRNEYTYFLRKVELEIKVIINLHWSLCSRCKGCVGRGCRSVWLPSSRLWTSLYIIISNFDFGVISFTTCFNHFFTHMFVFYFLLSSFLILVRIRIILKQIYSPVFSSSCDNLMLITLTWSKWFVTNVFYLCWYGSWCGTDPHMVWWRVSAPQLFWFETWLFWLENLVVQPRRTYCKMYKALLWQKGNSLKDP